ncbi:unnamed protein product [Staurois parvus]|uniref:Uncharacterized protein n=1 Tax=Staurois parvus TaxID=386267 RepID=A0ABN9GJX6_9NEOB|nr:unnamed protein product [Staurois parvus]
MTSSHSHCACTAPRTHSTVICSVLCPSDTADQHSMERAKDVRSVIAICQCPSVPGLCSSMPPASATFQCPSELPFSAAYQCQSVPPIVHQCCLTVPPNSAS